MPSIDFFVRSQMAFSKERYVTAELAKGFAPLGIATRVHHFSEVEILRNDPPSLGFLLDPLFPGYQPVARAFGVPHFYWSLDYLAHALPYIENTWSTVAHRAATPLFPHVMPLSPGVDPALHTPSTATRPLDFVLFEPLVDLEALVRLWDELLEPEEKALLLRGVYNGQRDDLFYLLEEYEEAQKTLELVRRFEGYRLDMFGNHVGKNLIKRFPNVHLRTELPYTEHFEVLKMSKYLICTEDSPWILPAWACGCCPIHDPGQISAHFDHEKQHEVLTQETWAKRAEQIVDRCASIF